MATGVKYICPYKDHSGYGEASRNYVLALHRAGVPITLQPHCFERDPPPVGTEEDRAILESLVNKDIEYDTVIIHLTPDLIPQHAAENKGKRLISYTVWETDLLHPKWASVLEQGPVDEIWVPCQWNIDAFRNSGVTKPMFKVPHGIDVGGFDAVDTSLFDIEGIKENGTYTFYSILQWNARKNPDGLLRAYYNAFNADDNVKLLLKAYVGGASPSSEANTIKNMVMSIKRDMGPLSFPKVSLITDFLSSDQMKALHSFGDCCVSLSHGEGWGLTTFEAGLAGNPVISTGAGGCTEYLTQENSFLVRSQPSYVSGMSSFNPWYLGNQQWYDPDLIEASKAMKFAFQNSSVAKAKGQKLKTKIADNFSWDKVAAKMIERL
jgi:glycosyltransferase involved in cell wall biosynthesis